MIRVVRLISGEQIVTQVKEKEDKKDFLYLVEPLKMEIVPKLSKEFMVEEHMSLTEWIFHSQTKEHPIHKSKILTVANANDSLSEYYNNIKEHLKTRTWKMGTRQEMNELSEEEEKAMSDEDIMDYLRGNRTLH
jgi:hypothetical protein|tara:strand:+ start:1843 stop:2244 length:402 start_codon:yes stop_codon:yes gene_type:complete